MRIKTSELLRYGLALVVSIAAYGVSKALGGSHVLPPLTPYFVAVVASAYWGGLGPGLVAALLSLIFVPLVRSPEGLPLLYTDQSRLVVFAVGATLAAVVTAAVKRKEQRAREHDNWLHVVLCSVAEGVVVTDAQGRITLMNPQAQDLTGWRQEDAVGRHVEQVVVALHQQTRERIPSLMQTALDGGGTTSSEIRTVLVATDAVERPIDCSAAPIRDQYGAVVGVVVSLRDLTRLRRADDLVRRNQAELEDFFETAPMGLRWIAPDGTILRANQAELDLVGCSREEYLGRNFREFLVDGPQADDILGRLADGQVLDDVELQMRCGDGSIKDVCISSSGLFLDGKPMPSLSFTRDITAQKRAEQESRKARTQAESASRAKDQFLAVLSHELRTPLTPVALALAELVERTNLPGEVRNRLTMIQRNVELEVRLIEDLLDVTRIAQGKLLLHKERTDVHALIRYVLDICEGDVQSRHQTLTTDLGTRSYQLLGDPARLQQVLWNLVKNAVKFTPEGGSILIRTRDGDGDAHSIVIEVTDTGIGFETRAQSRIFEAFQQVEAPLQHLHGGLGLGLAISKAIVDAHRGTLTGTSPGPGLGATFKVELPAIAPALHEEARPEPDAVASGADRPLRVLLVEDHSDTRQLLAQLLEKRNCVVRSAGTVANALQLAEEHAFDVLVSDLGLPDGSGLDLMRKLSAKRPIPAIALSGYATDKDVAASLAAGFTQHVIKPVDFARLLSLIHEHAGARRDPATGDRETAGRER